MPYAVALLLLFVMSLGACAPQRHGENPVPVGSMVPGKPPELLERREDAFGPAVESMESLPDTEEVLEELEKANRRLNERLSKVLAGEIRRVKRVPSLPDTGDGGQPVAFDYLDADLAEVVRQVMDLLGESYILHPGVKGRVSVHITDTLTRAQVLDLVQALLRMNGAIMLLDGQVWRVVPMAEAPALAPVEGIFLAGEARAPSRGQIVRVFHLGYISAAEMNNVIKPFLSRGALVYANEGLGMLLVCDFPHSLLKIEQIINLFDVSVFADMHLRVHTLRHMLAADMVKELDRLAKATGINTPKGPPAVSFLSLERLNMLLVVSRARRSLEFIDIWIEELDQEIPQIIRAGRSENIFVYYVQNSSAADIVASLEGIFAPGRPEQRRPATPATPVQSAAAQGRETEPGEQVPIGQQIAQQADAAAAQPTQAAEPGGIVGKLTGEVVFVVDEVTNSILTRANAEDYRTVLSVIGKLDIYPKQVLIEVIIAEVSLTDETRLGIDWRYLLDMTGNASLEFSLDNPAIASGLAVTLVDGERLRATLNAFARDNRTNILSSPHIMSSNHREAKIDIGQEVPILTQVTETRDPTQTDPATAVQQNIQYRNTGILLSVTPHINDRGLVRLELSQEISSIESNTLGAINSPLFRKRLATTEVVINDQQTIVIGGLMEQDNSHNETNVPFVRRVPLFKYLFGYEEKIANNRELLIFITPHVVESREDNDFISRNFIKRLQAIKRNMLRS